MTRNNCASPALYNTVLPTDIGLHGAADYYHKSNGGRQKRIADGTEIKSSPIKFIPSKKNVRTMVKTCTDKLLTGTKEQQILTTYNIT